MFGIAIFSLVYSGILNYYGKIIGNVNVQGPIFYAYITDTNKNSGDLLLNQKPSSVIQDSFDDGHSYLFRSGNLSGINFDYIPICKFSVKIKSVNGTNVTLTCKYKTQNKKEKEIEICSIPITTSKDWNIITASCQGNSSLSSVEYIIYEIKGTTPSKKDKDTYRIETNPNGDTYLQITKAWTRKPY